MNAGNQNKRILWQTQIFSLLMGAIQGTRTQGILNSVLKDCYILYHRVQN